MNTARKYSYAVSKILERLPELAQYSEGRMDVVTHPEGLVALLDGRPWQVLCDADDDAIMLAAGSALPHGVYSANIDGKPKRKTREFGLNDWLCFARLCDGRYFLFEVDKRDGRLTFSGLLLSAPVGESLYRIHQDHIQRVRQIENRPR